MLFLLVSVVIFLKLQFTQTNIPYEEELTSSNAKPQAEVSMPGIINQDHSSAANTPNTTQGLLPKTEKLNTEKTTSPANNTTAINKRVLADKGNSNRVAPVTSKNKLSPSLNTNNNISSIKPEQTGITTTNNNLAAIPKTDDKVTPGHVLDTLENIANTTISTGNKDTMPVIANTTPLATPADSLQNIYKNKKQKSNYSFSIAAFNQYMLVNNAYNGANNSVIKDEYGIDFSEKAKSSMSTGMSFHINKNNFSLGVGLAYTTIQFNKIYNASDIYNNKSADSVLTNELATKSPAGYKRNIIDQNLRYIEIPVSLSYKFGNKAFHFSSQIGASFQWLLSTETYLFESNNKQIDFKTIDDAKDQRFQHFQITYFTSVHANYQIGKWSFFAGPIIKLHQNQLYNDDFIKRNPPLFIGIESGLKFNF